MTYQSCPRASDTVWSQSTQHGSNNQTQSRQAEHKNFYYKEEHVILTTKAGCADLLDSAVRYLSENFIGEPVPEICHALGDSKRPQHKTVQFKDGRIIVTGKKSSDLVGKVSDFLQNHYASTKDKAVVNNKMRQTANFQSVSVTLANAGVGVSMGRKTEPLLTKIQCGDGNAEKLKCSKKVKVKEDWGEESTSGSSTSVSISYQEPYNAVPPHKEQKRLTTTHLFSKAITAIHSQSRTGAQTNPDLCQQVHTNPPCENSTDGSPDIIVLESHKPTDYSIPQKNDSKPSIAESLQLNSCSSSATSGAHVDMHVVDAPVCDMNISKTSLPKPLLPDASSVDAKIQNALLATDENCNTYTTCAKVVVAHNELSSDDASIISYSQTGNPLVCTTDNMFNSCEAVGLSKEPNEEICVNSVRVFEREMLLQLSSCELSKIYPSHVFIDAKCEVVISSRSQEELFDYTQYRMPELDHTMFNVYSAPFNSNLRRPELQDRKYVSTSDPRSWGDSSIHKRGRKMQSAPVDALYSESAYNCMEPIPEHATYCSEIDKAFKDTAKVVPGVAFTRRPKESQDDNYVQELLRFYEPQGN